MDHRIWAPTASGQSAAETAWTGWAALAARVCLGVVFAWFGWHELRQPGLWTGYVPVLSSTSTLALVAVIAHGVLLLVLAAALVVGILPRAAGLIAAALMAEIVVSLTVHGLSDIVARDLGVLGLALAVTAAPPASRWVLTR
ncbi:MAG: hypothetical protein ACYCXA_09080 [Actinomycetes bacterium]